MLSATQLSSLARLPGVLMLLLSLSVVGPVLVLAGPAPGARTIDSRIVCHTYRYCPVPQICIMDPSGGNTTRLTFTDDYEQCPALSPTGTRIAFESTRDHITNHLYIMNVNGGNPHRVTTVSNEEAHAAWSPRGTQLACSVVVDGAYDIYTMNDDGSNRIRLTTDPAHDMAPDWSPNGARILFESLRSGHAEVYIMNVNGTEQAPFLNTPNETYGAKWSPDGTKIAYNMTDPSSLRATIHVVNTDGSGDTCIVNTAWDNYAPDWAPDGSRIAFMSMEYGSTAEICSVLPYGSDVQRLTFGLTDNGPPSWGPTPATSAIAGLPTVASGLYLSSPARARADLRLVMDRAAPASLELFDSTGRLVRTILREQLTPGTRTVSWDGRDDAGCPVGSGMYYCRLVTGEASCTAKLVFVR
jgi:Tol biopolymer transport system component